MKKLAISYSSLKECRAILLLAQKEKLDRNSKIDSDLDILAAHIYKLIKKLGITPSF
jgi:hypothetical protein